MNETKINVIVPCYNAGKNLDTLATSLLEQSYSNWQAYLMNDMSVDDTWHIVSDLCAKHDNFIGIKNNEKKWALRNIADTCYSIEHKTDEIITIVDGDDFLVNPNAFMLLNKAFNSGAQFIWTKHRWDVNGQNISKAFPIGKNPYHVPWVTSHLRAFSLELFRSINKDNFKDPYNNWFIRGYDQALSLPLLYLAKNNIKFIEEVCYQYNLKSVSMPNRNDGGAQLNAIKFIRARGIIL